MQSKRDHRLSALASDLHGRLPEDAETVLGTTYKLRLLKPEADDWIARHTDGTTAAAVMLNARKPTLACAITAINFGDEDGEIPIEKLFQLPDDMDANVKEALIKDSNLLRDWRREQVLEWLRDLDTYVVQKLYDKFHSMLVKHKEALSKLENFSKKTPSAV